MKLKKLLIIFLALITLISLASCKNEGAADAEEENNIPALIRIGGFTGTNQIEADNSFNGGYLYKDETEDGLTVITNCAVESDLDETESYEEYAARVIETVTGKAPEKLSLSENSDYTETLGYLTEVLYWETDGGERICDGIFLMTHTHTYLYFFDTTAENREEMKDVWFEALGEIVLE